MTEIEQLRHDIAALQRRADLLEAKPALGLWVPEVGQPFWRADHIGSVKENFFDEHNHRQMLARANVYRSEQEAQARAELDNRLAIHAMLRQLGGGDDGLWAVKYSTYDREWMLLDGYFFSPGEARFETKEAAQAALDYLRERGVLVDGRAL